MSRLSSVIELEELPKVLKFWELSSTKGYEAMAIVVVPWVCKLL